MTVGTDAPIQTDVPVACQDEAPTPILVCAADNPSLWHRVGTSYAQIQAKLGPACMPAPGSIAGICLSCDGKIWIGPAQQQMLPAATLCPVCALPLAVEGADISSLKFEGRGS
jgi:hypothetical protein